MFRKSLMMPMPAPDDALASSGFSEMTADFGDVAVFTEMSISELSAGRRR